MDQYLQYLKHVRHLSQNTLAAYSRDIESFRAYLHGLGLPEADPPEAAVRGFVAGCSRKGLSSRTINRLLSALRGYYRFRQKVTHDRSNPFRDVRSLRTGKPLPSFLFEEEVEELLRRDTADFWQLRDRLILELLYSTGCRVSELTAIDLGDLAPKDGSLRVFGKGNRERLVFVGRQAREILREYLLRRRGMLEHLGRDRSEQALLINRRGGRLTPRGIEELLKKLVREAGVEKPVSPHTFRHSFATHILNRGADIRIVQELLGHASLSTTQVYTHLDVEGLRKVYERAHPHARAGKEQGT